MRLRVEHVSLVGTTREVAFRPGLNVVLGPITTGKTTLMRLLRILLGSGVPVLPPEVREHVSALAGRVVIGDEHLSVVRPLVSTPTAKVDLATDAGEALRLPAIQPDQTAETTYGRWLLSRLGLPDLDVAAAPTRPAESDRTRVSINDYLTYCQLRQEEIDTSVFGSEHPQRNIKRQYAFRILYGLFDAHLAKLQGDLRQIDSELRLIRAGADQFLALLQDTPWQNRAVLQQELAAAEDHRAALQQEQQQMAAAAQHAPRAVELRRVVQRLDIELAEAQARQTREAASVKELRELMAQLETQSSRLTKSIVAGARLYDLDFKVCPRCASPVENGRQEPGHCYLCLQQPQAQLTREDLVREQDRLVAQIDETDRLVAAREEGVAAAERELARLAAERGTAAAALEEQTAAYVSDQADHIARVARERAEVEAAITRLGDYLRLYQRLDAARAREGQLEQRKVELEAEIEQAEVVEAASEERIERLEEHFGTLIDAFGTPVFPGEPRAAINRRTYLPILNGRSFDQLSSGGLKVLVNLAYALAHHLTALDFDLPLPGLLAIDGITKNVGRDEYDQARVNAVFDTLLSLSEQHGDRLQIIVAANDVPAAVDERHIVLRLSADDRLIPLAP